MTKRKAGATGRQRDRRQTKERKEEVNEGESMQIDNHKGNKGLAGDRRKQASLWTINGMF